MIKYQKDNKNDIIDFCVFIVFLVYSYITAFVLTANSPTATKVHFYTLVHNIPVSIQTITFMIMSTLSAILYYYINTPTKKLKEYSRR